MTVAGLSSSDRTLPVAETFVSLQGEGRLAGTPSWFLRVSGCNLRCVWCDTPYASWRPESRGRPLASLVGEAGASGVRHAVLTGGEPMLFPLMEDLASGIKALPAPMHITVETAGTIYREIACDLMSISPKLANSTPTAGEAARLGGDADAGAWPARHEGRRIDTGVLQALLERYPDRQLKFVFTGRSDVDEIEALLSRVRGWAPEEVMLMPEGVGTPDAMLVSEAVSACMERGWRYCHRLHIGLFGNRRGT